MHFQYQKDHWVVLNQTFKVFIFNAHRHLYISYHRVKTMLYLQTFQVLALTMAKQKVNTAFFQIILLLTELLLCQQVEVLVPDTVNKKYDISNLNLIK